ncbi:PREDICTED: L10-interacting MYB domain-containing protein-like [Camelina sativa]|uniref:L10-interacting MYB domain-containing protein-like n=1 Tax=Camelina sativa TaxID=90675 RepID=A0ABM0XPA8_CAMSA|nr:PREDICTED: L10-interacting MYB domain-containing protein-like [Camelina sativa]XP_010488866.1 PREDICTED: L10-interacting MYB domain-containing protein-like [Camelina sativa]
MTPRASWKPEYHRKFVDLCVEHKAFGHLPGMEHILTPFGKETGARFTINQLKNHYDVMLKQWKVWLRLVQCSDMKWDPQTKKFGATDQDWANYLLVHPEARPYRWQWPPLFFEKLEVIFASVNIDGEGTSGSRKRKQRCEHRYEENDTGSAASNIHPRYIWSSSSSSHDIFVELCFQESSKPTRRNGSCYPKETWDMMVEMINRETGANYTPVQLKNHWFSTMQSWREWCQTVDAPILKWDANTGKFGATNEGWKNYLKVNPKASKYRWNPIPHAEKLATIFRGIEPGNAQPRTYRRRVIHHHSEAPQMHEPAPSSAVCINEPVTGGSDDIADNYEDNVDEDHEAIPLIRLDLEDDVETVTPVCHWLNTELMENIPVDASTLVKEYEYTIPECMECLDVMDEVEKGSDLYMFALDLFMTKEHRQIFLLLKTSSLKMSWLLRRRYSG